MRTKLKDILLSKKSFLFIITLWLALQVIYVFNYWGVAPSSDGSTYLNFAQECIDANSWYPNLHNMSDSHLFAPGYVNLLILVKKIFGSFEYIKILNIILNIALLFTMYKLAKKVFSSEIARLSVILYCLTFSNYTIPIAISSELSFALAMFLAIYLITLNKPQYILLAGILIALGNWVRPVAIVFILTALVYMMSNKYKLYNYAILFIAIVATIFCIAKPVNDKIGKYLYTTTATGHNLAHATSGKASATPNFAYRQDPYYADLVNKEYEQKLFEADPEVQARAIQWILENPIDYLSLFPKKFLLLYSIDNWTIRSIKGKGFASILANKEFSKADRYKIYAKAMLQSTVFYLIIFFFAYYIISNFRNIISKQNILILIPILGTAMLLIMVVVDRYHHPFMPIITIYAASAFYSLINKKEAL